MNEHLMNSYRRLPVAFVRGEGAWLWDDAGVKYLDALSGIAVCGLGHAHPQIAQAVCEQARTLVHTSNLYDIPIQSRLAEKLTRVAGMDKVFFCNSGAEANEAAIKIARLYATSLKVKEPEIIVASRSFHGRTMATLSATGNPKIKAGFEPLLAGFRELPYGDVDALRELAADKVVALMLEPVQGEGGVVVPDPGYLKAVRGLCDERRWLLICDEVQSGLCRTGRWFAVEHSGIAPDVMTLAKSLGNGVPIGACLARGAAAELVQPGSHGSTFGGNPLACSAALAVLDVLEADNLAARAERLGERMLNDFKRRLSGVDGVVEVRGQGLMIGIELRDACAVLVERALKRRLLINVTADRVVRLLPPLIISESDADSICELTSTLIEEFLAG